MLIIHAKGEFLPIRAIPFQQGIFDTVSTVCMFQQYILSGDTNGRILISDMRPTTSSASSDDKPKSLRVLPETIPAHMVAARFSKK